MHGGSRDEADGLVDIFLSLSRDATRWVRLAAFQELGKTIAAYLPGNLSFVGSPSWSPRHPRPQ